MYLNFENFENFHTTFENYDFFQGRSGNSSKLKIKWYPNHPKYIYFKVVKSKELLALQILERKQRRKILEYEEKREIHKKIKNI